MPTRSQLAIAASGALLALLAVFYWLGLTSVAGPVHDDVVYLVTAKALALGDGYRLISWPGSPYQVAYPPLYPALLAIVWKVLPSFPGNLLGFKALNILAALAIVILTYQLLYRVYGVSRRRSGLVALMVALSGPFIVFMDLTMSELVFLASLMLSLFMIERKLARPEALRARDAIALGFWCVLPMMARQVGIALPVALCLYLALSRRWKLLVASLVSITAWELPWFGWLQYLKWRHAPVTWDYVGWVANDSHGFQPLVFVSYLHRNLITAFTHSIPDAIAPLIRHGEFDAVLQHFKLGGAVMGLSILVTSVALAGYVASLRKPRIWHLFLPCFLGMVCLINWDPGRYVYTLIPLWLYAFVEGAFLLEKFGAAWRPAARFMAVCLVLLSLGAGSLRLASFAHHRQFHDALLSPSQRASLNDLDDLVSWSGTHLPANALWLHNRDPLMYLLTGHQAIAYGDGPNPSPATVALLKAYACYLVVPRGPEFETTGRQFIRQHPDKATLVYDPPNDSFRVYKLTNRWP